MTPSALSTLPGETAPLTYTAGRGPITLDEALGVLRRTTRRSLETGRSAKEVPDTLPAADAPRASSIYRLPPLMMAYVRARAEVEGRTVTDVIEESLRAYANGTPAPSAEHLHAITES